MANVISFAAYTGWTDVTDPSTITVDTRRITAADLLRYEQLGIDVSTYLNALDGNLVQEYLQISQKAVANGVATLDSTTKIPVAQIPDLSATYIKSSLIGSVNGVASLGSDGKVPAAQLTAAIRRTSYTATNSFTSGTEASIGAMTVATSGVYNASDFSVTGVQPGQLKIVNAGEYAFNLHGGYTANNFGDGTTNEWLTIFNVTQNKLLARNVAAGGNELNASCPTTYCNAGDVIEFRIKQSTGATKTIDSKISASRIG